MVLALMDCYVNILRNRAGGVRREVQLGRNSVDSDSESAGGGSSVDWSLFFQNWCLLPERYDESYISAAAAGADA